MANNHRDTGLLSIEELEDGAIYTDINSGIDYIVTSEGYWSMLHNKYVSLEFHLQRSKHFVLKGISVEVTAQAYVNMKRAMDIVGEVQDLVDRYKGGK